ncbi:Psy4p KNAG_0F03630 [Huiozyma naganishii CBS 8797]|uniref:Uncharacterized protein n=1 Tax=Huiozyma naganishii (strain ATCC MYA-139 / BCRC 22969 / CBS 8797 / KCTC 17520 / NBRC 10181 / NCYC 3082 / Yp74L-3) TaxID=1071383 RepID=J7R846_HUIN7|nr:hypothetical protein KNAG_0F03630 [Kazachstania naganishii CBS 8797]CCK71025.1 hypothetical protein KNAG_0F03630 [Kazachstania naganishii CBS 8797]
MNRNGIESEELYGYLRRVVVERDEGALCGAHEWTPLLVDHFSETIPRELFQVGPAGGDVDSLRERLVVVGGLLTDRFVSGGGVPFTFVRVCELCFQPFDYFRPSELDKFVRAMEKCVEGVQTFWRGATPVEESAAVGSPADATTEDVSMSVVPFIEDEKAVMREYESFFKEIDGVMSLNAQYEEDDDDDDDVNGGGGDPRAGDFLSEEYYEDDSDDADYEDPEPKKKRKSRCTELDNYEYADEDVDDEDEEGDAIGKGGDEELPSTPNKKSRRMKAEGIESPGSSGDKIRTLEGEEGTNK